MSFQEHIDHTQIKVDPTNALGLSGLPPEYQQLLSAAQLDRDMVMNDNDKQNVLAVLNFHLQGPPKMPT